jgi:ribonuclease R
VIIFDQDRKIDRVVARSRNDAHRLIEECMLAANICASLILDDSNITGIYRVHDAPDEDRIADARVFLRQFKLLLGGGDQPEPKHFSEVINKVEDPLTAKIVQTALLRSMKQARYDVENDGHYALNFDSYTHFTSPIRRYSDLIVHRQIRRLINDPDARDDSDTFKRIQQSAEQASMAERRAESATREAVQWLKCEFMSHKIGDKLWGVVSSVTDFGLFVELEEFYVDGLVHITSLGNDYYRFDSDKRELVGETSNRIYKIGQRLEVQVSRVDMDQGRIDFSLSDVVNEKFDKKKRKEFGHPAKGAKRNSGSGSKRPATKNNRSTKKKSNRGKKKPTS